MATIGSVIDGKYEILKQIGKGGMSKVYLAMDKRLNKQWAVKEITKNARDKNNEVVVQSAVAEANMIKKLDHPALPRIVDIIDNGNVLYVIMDYIEGEPLSSVLEEFGAQPQDVVIEWAKQLCEVLDYLHTRTPPIIYRDMKPANVMLKPDGNIKLIDFGIAREYKEENLADTVCLGTKGYAAPEQFGGKGQTTPSTDIYCLGVSIYHLITGRNPCDPPYEIYPIRHWNPNLSGGLERIIQKCTMLNPADRYQSCAELLYALEHYEEEDDVYKAREKKKLNTFIGIASASVVSLLIGILGFAMKSTTINNDYDTRIKKNTVAEYQAAILLKPTELKDYNLNSSSVTQDIQDAYNGLISYYEKNTFDEAQANVLNSCLKQENLNLIEKDSDYAKLMFRVGKLYFFNYVCGSDNDSQATNAKLAVEWFKRSIESVDSGNCADDDFYNKAKVYAQIGDFYQTLESSIKQGEDAGKYKTHWDDLNSLMQLIEKDSNKNEFVELSAYKMVVYSIEKYARKFSSDGITQNEMQSMFNMLKTRVDAVTATSEDTTIPMKNEIVGRYDDVQRVIDLAYSQNGGNY